MASLVTNANAYQFALGKQTNGTTALGTASYAMPVFDADIHPLFELARVEVTDASSVEGDPYKKPTSWEADVTIPALGASVGQVIQAMWATDTPSGTAPTTHTFTGLGGSQSFIGLFDDFTNASKPMSYANGIATELTFSADQDGGPLKVNMKAVGTTPSQASYSVTTTDALSNGYFSMQLASSTIEIDNDTPDVNPSSAVTNVESFSLTVSRNVTPAPTADSVTIANLAQGKLTTSGQMTFFYSSWQEFLGSYFGTVSGTAVSSTILYGALDLTFKHSVQSTWQLEIYVPKVAFIVPSRQPDASGGPLKLPVTLQIAAPASGERVQPILKNSTASAY